METKKCNKCQEVKQLKFFGVEKRALNGYKPRCKSCMSAYQREFYSKNKDLFKNYTKKYYEDNKDLVKERVREYQKDPLVKKRKIEYMSNYVIKNKQILNNKANEREKKRYKSDPRYLFIRNVRKSVYRIKNNSKRTEELLGYKFQDLIDKLGRLPKSNENIDHKVPVSWFKTNTPVKIINNLENMQIISMTENVRKSNTFCHPVSPEYYNECFEHVLKEKQFKLTKHDKNTL